MAETAARPAQAGRHVRSVLSAGSVVRFAGVPEKQPGKVKRLTERVVLGVLMTVGVAAIERRLRKAARRRS